MKLNKREQYAILLCLYLTRSSRTTLKNVSESLNISLNFLQQIARNLRNNDLLLVTKGPGGGVELKGDPTVGKILRALGTDLVLSDLDNTDYNSSGLFEHRSLGLFSKFLNHSMAKLLDISISSLGKGLVERELAMLDKAGQTNMEV